MASNQVTNHEQEPGNDDGALDRAAELRSAIAGLRMLRASTKDPGKAALLDQEIASAQAELDALAADKDGAADEPA